MTMSPEERKSLRVGATVAVALALFAIGIFLIGREQRFWERKVSYEIRFARTNGLRTGAIVSLTGVDIGSVSEVSFPDDPSSSYISVWIDVAGRVASRIREDTVARVRTIGLLGDKYIELSGGSPTAAVIPPRSQIPSADPIDIEALLGESGDIITNIVEVTNSLRSVLASIDRGEGLLGEMVKNREGGAATLADVQKTMAHLEATTASFQRIVSEVEGGKGAFGVLLRKGQEVERLLANLEKTSRAAADLTARLEKAQGALPRLIEDKELAQSLLGDLRRASRNLAEVTDKVNRGEGTMGKLINDPALYGEAKGLVHTTRTSLLFQLIQGMRGIFPPYGSGSPPTSEASSHDPAALPIATPTPAALPIATPTPAAR